MKAWMSSNFDKFATELNKTDYFGPALVLGRFFLRKDWINIILLLLLIVSYFRLHHCGMLGEFFFFFFFFDCGLTSR